MKTWIAVVKIEDKGRDGLDQQGQLQLDNTTSYYHSIYEVADALQSLGDCPEGLSYTFEFYEVVKEKPHYGTEKDFSF